MNERSSIEVVLVEVNGKITKVIQTKRFIENQGFKIGLYIIYQDNTSTIKFIKNGYRSTDKRTRCFDLALFYTIDYINRKKALVEYYPTKDILADYITKSLIGADYKHNCVEIMNL